MSTPDAAGCPLAEFDADPDDPIRAAAAAQTRAALPPRAVGAFLGRSTTQWATEHGFRPADHVTLVNGRHPLWTGRFRGVEVALVDLPVGAPAAVIVVENLFLAGVHTLVGVGSCGGLVHFEEGEFVLPSRALRDEGTSYHYAPAGRWIDTDAGVRAACAAAVAEAGLAATEAPTWTTDAYYRETRGKIAARRAEGCVVVDMECAALAACAALRGAAFAQILFTADTLAGGTHDVRGWGHEVHVTALELALRAATLAPPR